MLWGLRGGLEDPLGQPWGRGGSFWSELGWRSAVKLGHPMALPCLPLPSLLVVCQSRVACRRDAALQGGLRRVDGPACPLGVPREAEPGAK